MEQVRKRIIVELVSSANRLQKLINMPTFKHATPYNDNLSAISLANKVIKFDKPIYIGMLYIYEYKYYRCCLIIIFTGFAVLDISKTLMYDYHYNVMKKHYGDKIELMYTDTGKFYICIYITYNNSYYSRFTGILYTYGQLL